MIGRHRMKAGNHQRRILLFLLILLAAYLALFGAAQSQEPPVDTTVYLPIASTFRVTQPIAAGGAHTCAVLPSGIVRCWGSNAYGQLGDGTWWSSTLPVTVEGLSGITMVAASGNTTCAGSRDSVWCWGEDYGGIPVRIVGVPPATQLAIWEPEVCALTTENAVICWRPGDALVERISLKGATALVQGLFKCALMPEGLLRCWSVRVGFDVVPELDWPGVISATAAAAGSWRASRDRSLEMCVADAQRDVKCWRGLGRYNGDVDGPSEPTDAIPEASGAVALAGAGDHLCALRSDGRVVCWGAPNDGEGGQGNSWASLTPVPGITNAIALAAGTYHVCAMEAGGGVWCWGWNSAGQLGNPLAVGHSDAPLPMPVGAVWGAAAEGTRSCAIDAQQKVLCWGGPQVYGISAAVFVPQSVGIQGATRVAVDPWDVCALVPDQGILCTRIDWLHDAQPNLVAGTTHATALANGERFDCFVDEHTDVWCWSGDELKQVAGAGPASAVSIAPGGGTNACVLKATGKVACWNWPYDEPLHAAVDVPNLAQVRALAVGYGFGCAVRKDRQVACWGVNDYGQLGDGTFNDSATPVLVPGVAHVIAVAASDYGACALRDDGTVLCWGNGEYQQGTTASEVFRMPEATAITMGDKHICVTVGSELHCQGDNSRGQLAQNPGWTPVRVEGLTP